jgi:hypothetical protein
MRACVALAMLILLTGTAQAESGRSRFEVKIPFHPVNHVSDVTQLARPCLTNQVIYGCTRFGGRVVECDCEVAVTGWQLRARATFIPVTYLSDRDLLRHEKLHILDVEQDARRYLDELTSTTHPTLEACRKAGADAAAAFPATMDAFQLRSNTRRHPDLTTRMAVEMRARK